MKNLKHISTSFSSKTAEVNFNVFQKERETFKKYNHSCGKWIWVYKSQPIHLFLVGTD